MTSASAADASATPWIVDPDVGDIDDTPPDLPDDQEALSPREARTNLINRTRRRNTHLRRTGVQLARGAEDSRLGPLVRMVKDRRGLALHLYLLLIALEPIDGPADTISGKTWARLLSTDEQERSPTSISRTWAYLEDLQLIRREGGRVIRLREDGSGEDYTRPGTGRDPIGYFSLPRQFWTEGWDQTLSLPGVAMLLILLAETNQKHHLTLTIDQFASYYGLSTSTVDRGLADLARNKLLGQKDTWVAADRSRIGRTRITSWWLKNPFSTAYRTTARARDLQELTTRGRRATPGTTAETTESTETGSTSPAETATVTTAYGCLDALVDVSPSAATPHGATGATADDAPLVQPSA